MKRRVRRSKKAAAYSHLPATSTQKPDTAPGPYYVSAIDGPKFALVSGPYPTHAEALAVEGKARQLVQEHCAWAAFYAFGTVRLKSDCTHPGRLQEWGYNLALSERHPTKSINQFTKQ